MKDFLIHSSEVVYYSTAVKANSAEQARQMVVDGEVDIGDPDNGHDFQILEVEQMNYPTKATA